MSRVLILLVGVVSGTAIASAQSVEKQSPWSRSVEERDTRLAQAESGGYYIRHIYIGGNTYTRHREFQKRMASHFNEGYIFSRQALVKSVERIAQMRAIYPITIKDVEVMLDDEKKYIDFTINVRQKPKK